MERAMRLHPEVTIPTPYRDCFLCGTAEETVDHLVVGGHYDGPIRKFQATVLSALQRFPTPTANMGEILKEAFSDVQSIQLLVRVVLPKAGAHIIKANYSNHEHLYKVVQRHASQLLQDVWDARVQSVEEHLSTSSTALRLAYKWIRRPTGPPPSFGEFQRQAQ